MRKNRTFRVSGVWLVAAVLAANISAAFAQSNSVADVAAKESREAKKEKQKKDFATQEQSYQKLSTPGRALADNPIDKKAKASDPVTRSGDKKKDFAAQEQSYQKLSTPGRALVDNPTDKKAKAADPVTRRGDKKKDFASQEGEFQKQSTQ